MMQAAMQIVDRLEEYSTEELVRLRDRLSLRAKVNPNDPFLQARILYLVSVIGMRAMCADLRKDLEGQRESEGPRVLAS